MFEKRDTNSILSAHHSMNMMNIIRNIPLDMHALFPALNRLSSHDSQIPNRTGLSASPIDAHKRFGNQIFKI
jgi:hypothetical protein